MYSAASGRGRHDFSTDFRNLPAGWCVVTGAIVRALTKPQSVLAISVIAAIVYGSLYPFRFHDFGPLASDLRHFLGTWKDLPRSRGDFLANLLLYAPLGLTVSLALGEGRPQWRGAPPSTAPGRVRLGG